MKNTVSLKMDGDEGKSCYSHAGCRKNIPIPFVQGVTLKDNEKRFFVQSQGVGPHLPFDSSVIFLPVIKI